MSMKKALLLSLILCGCSRAQLPEFSGARAFELLELQCDFGPRAPGSEGARLALEFFESHLRERADRVRLHRFEFADPYESGVVYSMVNVMASFRPQERRRVALAAHWDTRPRADQEPDPERAEQPILGANDGASGVAVLLTLAEILAQQPPPIGVDLLLFDGEDFGQEGDAANYLVGSRRFVRDHPQYRPEALILLDMVGDADLSIPMEQYSLDRSPELTHLVFERAMALALPAFDPRPGRPVLDDHIPFLQAGIPAVDLIDLDYPAWHTLGDIPAACSAESLEQVGRLLVAILYTDFAD